MPIIILGSNAIATGLGQKFITMMTVKMNASGKYSRAEDSFYDHSQFLKSGSRYSFLFGLSPTDYKGWAHGLKKAGYATNPDYANMLIRKIEEENLQYYDENWCIIRLSWQVLPSLL